MNDWFEWNGRCCTDFGIHVLEQPPPTLPEERVTFTDIPGRSGSLTTTEGIDVYNDITLTVECMIRDTTRLTEIFAWLKGAGKVTFANRQGGYYYARITNQIPFEKILRGNPHRRFSINFRCKPFWYANDVEQITINSSGYILNNPGTVHSEPVIQVQGNGEITLMINDCFIELAGVDTGITLDSTLQEAYWGEQLQNEKMTGDFPVLLPGNNLISWTGDVERLIITPNWRYL